MTDHASQSTSVELRPGEFLAGWDPATSRLFLPVLPESRVGMFVAVRISIRGTGIAATVTGTVVAVRRLGGRTLVPGVSLALEGGRASAANYLALVARGTPVDFNERDPRYAVERRLALTRGKNRFEATTINVSQGGCCVAWPGAAPAIGEAVRIRPGRAFLGPTIGATVCWAGGSRDPAVRAGLRVHAIGRAARTWQSIVEQSARAGAPVL